MSFEDVEQCGSARAGGLGDRPSPCQQPGSSPADCQPLGLLPFRSYIRGRVRGPLPAEMDGNGRRWTGGGELEVCWSLPRSVPRPAPQTISNAGQQGTPAVNELAARRHRPSGRRTSGDRRESSLRHRSAAGRPVGEALRLAQRLKGLLHRQQHRGPLSSADRQPSNGRFAASAAPWQRSLAGRSTGPAMVEVRQTPC